MRSALAVAALIWLSALEGGTGLSAAIEARGAHEAMLSVRSDPAGASVYVDGRFIGQTPIDVPRLAAGDHRVRLVADGFLENSRVVRLAGGKPETLHVRLTARTVRGAQAAGLKIVVLAGEDAVNVIQQKTAVNPLVEVRDRNDVPVAGVPVTFTLGGSNAAFAGGAQTVTVTTNAAGRAAVTSLTPVSAGPIQINVTATAQGQTAAVTITQTNVLTAAAAASVAAAAAGAGAGGAGGGLSGAAIAAIVGGAGAGALVAVRAAGGGGSPGPRDGGGGARQSCTFTVSPTSFSLSSVAGSVDISVSLSPAGCDTREWTATSHTPFITFGGGSSSLTLTGDTRVPLFVAVNPQGSPARIGTATIAGQTVTVSQNARCTFDVSPRIINIPVTGGSGTINVTVSPTGCENAAWAVNFIDAALTVNPTSGTGNGTVIVSMPPFTNPLGPQGGALSINGIIVSVVQATMSSRGSTP